MMNKSRQQLLLGLAVLALITVDARKKLLDESFQESFSA